MPSDLTPAQLESMTIEETREALPKLIEDLGYWEKARAGQAEPSYNYHVYTAKVELHRLMIAQVREKLLLHIVEKMEASTKALQSSTADMVSGVKALNDSVTSLEKTTTKLVKSSTRIEYLTMVVVLATISSIAITLEQINIWYSVIVSIAGLIALIRLWQKISKHPAFRPE